MARVSTAEVSVAVRVRIDGEEEGVTGKDVPEGVIHPIGKILVPGGVIGF